MTQNEIKRIIDTWIVDYNENCELMEIDSRRFQIALFLDKVVLRLWTNKFDPYDPECPFTSPEDAEEFCISDLKDEYGYIRKQTLSNAERFITPKLKEIEDKILNAEEKIKSLEYEIFINIRIRLLVL